MDEIEQIASKVLGKTSDGKTMMRYETPDEVDKTLLVGIPRHLNRTQYDLAGDEFHGIDINPIRASSFDLLLKHPISDAVTLTSKTMRQ